MLLPLWLASCSIPCFVKGRATALSSWEGCNPKQSSNNAHGKVPRNIFSVFSVVAVLQMFSFLACPMDGSLMLSSSLQEQPWEELCVCLGEVVTCIGIVHVPSLLPTVSAKEVSLQKQCPFLLSVPLRRLLHTTSANQSLTTEVYKLQMRH